MSENYTVIVCSSDKFSDCWIAFFSLFKRYWPGFNGNIVLITEIKSFSFEGLNIICPCVGKNENKNLSWSEVMIKSLETIDCKYFLLFLEDYFIKSPVKEQRLEELFRLMVSENFDHLMLIPMPGSNLPTKWPFLHERAKNAPYRLSTQCGFWRKEVFIKYLKPHETPWQFENWGTKRSRKIDDRFFSINPDDVKQNGYIIDYFIRGAVTKGKWQESVPEFLSNNGISGIDFSIRGFYNPAYMPPFYNRIKNRILQFPGELKSWLSLSKIK